MLLALVLGIALSPSILLFHHVHARLDLSPGKGGFEYCVGPNCEVKGPPPNSDFWDVQLDEASSGCPNNTMRIDTTDCQHYFTCVNGTHWVRESCGSHEAWNPYMEFCTKREYVKCDVTCNVNGKFKDDYDCRDFWVCVHKRPFRFTCANGTHYDDESGRCEAGSLCGLAGRRAL